MKGLSSVERYFIKADRFLLPSIVKNKGYLMIDGNQFGSFVEEVPVDGHVVDWSGFTIAPGLFDTHIHGLNGNDVMDGTTSAIQGISTSLASIGVTRFLPTTLTADDKDLVQALIAVKEANEEGLSGAQSEGIFLEGPYFTAKHKGVQNESYFRDPDTETFQHWQKLAGGNIIKVALAPERNGAINFMEQLQQEGIFTGIAHSDASFERCQHAEHAGASLYVHLFNGMSGLHHRAPGVTGAALSSDASYVEIICDGNHVHPAVVSLVLKLKGDNVVLISDCMRAGMLPDGTYKLGHQPVRVKNGVSLTSSGNLAGSTLTLLDAIINLQQWTNKPLHVIWHLASLTPAKSIGKEKELGSISAGKQADYVVLDQSLNIRATSVEGKVVYRK